METIPLPSDVLTRAVVRHLIATLAYRAAKVLRDVPPTFPGTSFGAATRKPVLVVAHLANLMAYSIRLVHGELLFTAEGGDDWTKEVRRFFDNLAALDRALASES